ncbi:hypothetical protein RAN3_2489 [plant metagenome]|uniref:Uncharacterized protein n=1 Tax=plant metagenome TaxID=1297885 RepID=A0A484U3K4_9ZZZZ
MILDGDLTDWSDACDRLILDAIAVYVAPPAAAQRAKEE